MKLIIDIPEEVKADIDNGVIRQNIDKIYIALANGTPLDDVKAEIDQYLFQNEFGSEYREEVSQIIDNIGKAESEDT